MINLIKKLIPQTIALTGGILTFTVSLSSTASAIIISNGILSGTPGSFNIIVLSGGETSDANLTARRLATGDIISQKVLFNYFTYIDVGEGGFRLDTGTPVLTGTNEVTSSGFFSGSQGNTINWTAVSTLDPNSTTYTNTFTFNTATGTLGNLRLFQYLDESLGLTYEDVVFFTRGSVAGGDLALFSIDNTEVYGLSQSGALSSTQGLVNASFTGWAANVFDNIEPKIITGTQTVSPTGVIDNLSALNHPVVGSAFGPGDLVSVLAWDANSSAMIATIITSLQGISDDKQIPQLPLTTGIAEPTPVVGLLSLGALGTCLGLKRTNQKEL